MAATAEARLIVRYFGRFAPRVADVVKSASARSMTPAQVAATSADSVPSVSRQGGLIQRANLKSPAANRTVSRSAPAGEKLSPFELQCFGKSSLY